MAEQKITEQQAAVNAVPQLTQMVKWLSDFEAATGEFPAVGGVDEDQVEETQATVRAARLAVAALLGQYVTDTSDVQLAPQQQVQQPQQTAAQQWAAAQQASGRRPVVAARPGEYQQQAMQQPQQQQQVQQPQTQTQAQVYGGWQ